MGNKNNKKQVLEDTEPVKQQVPPDTGDEWPPKRIPVDPAVHKLVEQTASRNRVSKKVLVDTCVEAMLGSLLEYGYDYTTCNSEKRKAVIGGAYDYGQALRDKNTLPISKDSYVALNDVGVFFGVKTKDLLQDAIMAQRYNWQRMQPVNARSMSSIRIHMFHLEQQGGRR